MSAYFDDNDWALESWKAVEELAAARGSLLSIALVCEPAQHRRRIVGMDRCLRGKLADAGYVENFAKRHLIERRGDASLRLDVTNLVPDDAAAQLAEWLETHSR